MLYIQARYAILKVSMQAKVQPQEKIVPKAMILWYH